MAVGFRVDIGIKALLIDTVFVEKGVFDKGDVIGRLFSVTKKKEPDGSESIL
jgi:hypothetical protein